MSEEEKGVERLDTTSTDAMHWAECFCEQATINSDAIEEGKSCSSCVMLDSNSLMGWFANYWAAINDPLANRIEQLEADKAELLYEMQWFVNRCNAGQIRSVKTKARFESLIAKHGASHE